MPSQSPAALLVLALFAAPVPAQTSGRTAPGQSIASARFNPLDPPQAIVAQPPPRVFRGQPVIGWDEYLRRKESLPARAPSHRPPSLEGRSLLATRAPESPFLQPIALAPSSSWEGIQQTARTPPDPDMAVGPEDAIQVVNSSIARFTKGGQQTNLTTFQQWYAALLPTICPSGAAACEIFDPSVRYDQLHGRFIVVAVAEDAFTGKSSFVVSVSSGATYAGAWKHFALDASLNGSTPTNYILDFPQFGYDNNAVYLTGNMFNAFNTVQYAKIRILKKSELYHPATTTLTYQDIWDLRNEDNTIATSLRPAQLRGRPGTGIPPGVFINSSDNLTADYLTLWRVNNPLTSTPTASRTTLKGVAAYSYPAFFAQLGTSLRIDPGDSRVLKAISRNGILYTARNAGYSDEPTTVNYHRIDLSTSKVTLEARKVNGTAFYPAFDIPASLGPDNVLPNNLVAGSSTSPTGELAYIGIPGVKDGEAPYEGNTRWGDYFGGAVDPVQGGLWVYGEYAKTRGQAAGRWGTWAAYFPWSTSPLFTDIPSASPNFDFINVMRLWGITTGCTPTAYCPTQPVTRGQMAVFIVRSITGDTFDFPATPYFTDVPATHPYFKFIQKMRQLNITAGCTATAYCPDDAVTRSQMAVFLVRGKLYSLFADDFTFPAAPYFTDVPATNARFSFIQKLRELGVTQGCSATTYCPEDPVTREQMAVFVVRAFLN